MTSREERLRELAEVYIKMVTTLFETIQCSGFTIEQVKAEVAKIDRGMVEEVKQ